MVGYPESLTDPSYRSQILILTFPLIGNYGVPSTEEVDELMKLPRYLESNKIHVAALIVGHDDADQDRHFSHFLAQSSLGAWLKREGVPALYGIDTRALTKRIREHGVMLGKVLFPKPGVSAVPTEAGTWLKNYIDVEWSDPNARNLVAEGE
jgi:carbamoyl-phosphate synthase/aspartate carbamoyltransferase